MQDFINALRANMTARGLTIQQANQALLALQEELPKTRALKMLVARNNAEASLSHIEEQLLRWLN